MPFEFEHILDPFLEFHLIDGFGEEVVGTGRDGAFDVAKFAQGGHHEDDDLGRLGILFELSTDLEAAEFRHHDVEQDQVRIEAGNFVERILAIDCHFGLAIDIDEIGLHQFAIGGIIIRDKDAAGIVHETFPCESLTKSDGGQPCGGDGELFGQFADIASNLLVDGGIVGVLEGVDNPVTDLG